MVQAAIVSTHPSVKVRKKLERLTIHDLRHAWKSNAMESAMDEEIRKAIMGHSRGISGRYGHIRDELLVQAIDRIDFEKGRTLIWVQ
jgi:integrase